MTPIHTWFIATTMMTAFSYLFYHLTCYESREPFLLGYVAGTKFPILVKYRLYSFIGWMMHYIAGVGFLLLNNYCLTLFDLNFNLLWGLPLGFLAGIVGIGMWKLYFLWSDGLPPPNYAIFYAQLVAAHIVFCTTAIATYNY